MRHLLKQPMAGSEHRPTLLRRRIRLGAGAVEVEDLEGLDHRLGA